MYTFACPPFFVARISPKVAAVEPVLGVEATFRVLVLKDLPTVLNGVVLSLCV